MSLLDRLERIAYQMRPPAYQPPAPGTQQPAPWPNPGETRRLSGGLNHSSHSIVNVSSVGIVGPPANTFVNLDFVAQWQVQGFPLMEESVITARFATSNPIADANGAGSIIFGWMDVILGIASMPPIAPLNTIFGTGSAQAGYSLTGVAQRFTLPGGLRLYHQNFDPYLGTVGGSSANIWPQREYKTDEVIVPAGSSVWAWGSVAYAGGGAGFQSVQSFELETSGHRP